jgi:hypothetical protein
MTRYYLTRLCIEGFRGINNEGQPLGLRFLAEKVNSIYALNGLGKSSVYDALSYAILGRIPKLELLEQSEDAESYINNRFHTASTATIELTFTADDGSGDTEIKVERLKDGKRTVTSPTATDPEAFLVALRSDFVLLDQETFIRFIRDKSLERGRTFSRLLGLSRLSDFRIALQKLANAGTIASDFGIDGLKLKETLWKQQVETLLGNLRKAFDQLTGQPYSGMFDAAKFSSGVIGALKQVPTVQPFCKVTSIGEIVFVEVEKAVAAAEKSPDRDRLTKLRDALKKLNDLAPLEGEIDEKQVLRDAIANRAAALAETSGPLLLTNYQSAVAVLESEEWKDVRRCPTCDVLQEGSLLETLQSKLAAYEKAGIAATEIKTRWAAAAWGKRWRDMESNINIKTFGEARDYERLTPHFNGGTATLQQYKEALGILEKLEASRRTAVDKIVQDITRLEQSLPESMVTVTRQVSTAKQAAADLTKYKEIVPKLDEAKKQLERRKDWESFINKAHRDFATAESTWIQNRQQKIAADYQKMHDMITRNPDVIPDFDRPANSERLHLRLNQFYGLTDLSANTLLQESYCNAIAISIFLSTALACPNTARFIVLDDVTSSFDGGHQFNLMELLRNQISPPANPCGLQVILLTHDTLLEKYLDKATHTGTWHHQKLIGRPPNGPVLTEQYNADRMRQRAEDFLNAGQTDAAAPWLRQYLEAVLSRIIRQTGVRVPLDYAMDDNKKMVQNALDAIADEIELLDRAGKLILEPQQVSDASKTLVPSLVSNFCAHYATGAFAGVTAHVLLGVLDDVDKLADCFKYNCTCQKAGQTIRRFYRDLTSKACRC